MTTCEEAKQMRSGINVQAKVVDKGEVRTVNTKFGETKVCDAYLEDESGRIKLTLWADDTEKVKNGDMVSLEGGYTTTFRNEVQLNKGRKDGKLEVISGDDGKDDDDSDFEKHLDNYKNRHLANFTGSNYSTRRRDDDL